MSCNEPAGREIEVNWSEEFFPYKKGKSENGWDLFFYPVGHVASRKSVNHSEIVHDQNCLNKWLKYNDFYQYRVQVNKLINRYIKVRQEIIDEVDDYYNSHMNNKVCIGAHVRFAGAHANEKPGSVSLDDYFDEIDALIKHLKQIKQKYRIYLATDSKYVVKKFQKKYKDRVLCIDAIRSDFNEEVHLIYDNSDYWLSHPQEFHEKKPGYKGGKDVLMDCLLLSKCHYFIHSTSNVSDFVTFFNPDIESLFLPKKIVAKERTCLACNAQNKWHNTL